MAPEESEKEVTHAPRSLILGVDPGNTGALSLLDPATNTIVASHAMPVTQVKFGRTNGKGAGMKVDAVGLTVLFEKIHKSLAFAVVEEVASRPGQGVASTFLFGTGYGMVQGVLASFQIPTHFVRPDVWKMLIGVTKDKKTSMYKATELFPESKKFWLTSAMNGHAEAALIAQYGLRFKDHYGLGLKVAKAPSEFEENLLG